ncbi:hypothetical protein Taro_044796 [Colocasia esculenta]|uniref:Fungal lipase-type domain-containing protein n=1 Tax=Colocasia esculenta TaxID=4460 RepID=A0A843X3A6_COLES|nr:hypothetical protein [Colocasia esculenta]
MLRESSVLKFVRDSSVMRPGYYVGVDVRKKLVIFGIRGTHAVYDFITDMITSSDQKVTFEGLSTHFGTAEAARWFLLHELATIRKCLEKHKAIGHSLGGAAAALLAIMLRKKTAEELGFDPCIVSAIGFGTPPCVSKELAESCSSYVSTVVLQDDIIPRLSTASLTRLRNEILQTDWKIVLERQDWKSIIEWVGNAKQAVSLVQDVGRKLSDYAKFRKISNDSDISNKRASTGEGDTKPQKDVSAFSSRDVDTPEELFVPGTMYFLKRIVDRGMFKLGNTATISGLYLRMLVERSNVVLPSIFTTFGSFSASRQIGNHRGLHKASALVQAKHHPIASLLQGCASSRDLKAVHAAVIKNDGHRDSLFANQFVTACFRFRRMDYALSVFSELADPNVFVYNAVIRGFVLCSAPAEALGLYVRMCRLRKRPTSYTFTSLVGACAQMPAVRFATAVHGHICKLGLNSHVFVQTALIDFYSAVGSIGESRKVFDEMVDRDAVCWTTMILAHAQVGDLDSARKLFDEMPDRSTVSWNTMIAGYARSGDVQSAASLFNQMPTRDLVSWTTMISCYSQNKQFKEAIETFEGMKGAGVSPDEVTMTTVISACAHLGALDLGQEAHICVLQHGFDLDVYTGCALVDMYAKCGSLERSLMVFFKLKKKNLFCWNSAIEGLAMHGHGVEALSLFRMMNWEDDVMPNGVTFVSVLSACTHSGLVEEGRQMFSRMMHGYSIEPEIEHYGCMVDLLGRAGHLQEALDMILSMKMEPSSVIWGALLGGCKIHGNMEIGEAARRQLMVLEPDSSGYFALSVNMYAQANKWNQVASIRGVMRDKGVQKRNPGCSWIEIDGKVYDFAASDKSHPKWGDVAALLDQLDGQLRRTYDLPDTDLHFL